MEELEREKLAGDRPSRTGFGDQDASLLAAGDSFAERFVGTLRREFGLIREYRRAA